MSQQKDDELIVTGGIRPRGEFFRNNIRPKGGRKETFKGVATGFSCGLGNEECELFKARSGAPLMGRKERFVPGGLRSSNGMGGAFVGNLGPRQFSGNASADLSAAGKVDLQAAEKARQARDVTSKSDQRMVGEARAKFGAAIANKRDAAREGFRGKTLSAKDLEKEDFRKRRGIAQAAKKVEGFAPKRSQMSEQYMRKVTPSKGAKGFRSQYGM